jgi:CHAT domain-containing protein
LYTFVEFKVEIRRGREGKHGHRVTVECEKPDGGRVGPTDAQPITSSVRRLMPAVSAEQRIDLGEELGQCMFPPRVLAAFTETLRALEAGTGIRVRLLCVDEEMARWPWELVRIALPATARLRYLFRDERFSLVRTVIDHRPVDQPKERRKLVILTVDATKVVDDQELEPDFPEHLPQAAPLRRFDLRHPTKKTIDELIDQIADGEDPLDIFHFTGHGRPPRDGQAGSLVLYRDHDTGSEHYRGDELARQLQRAGTSLAFVNACYTDQAAPGDGPGIAQSLTGIVPVVIAIRDAVRDRDAKDFAETFYQWLLNGSTVDEAVTRGRVALDESLPGWGYVVLYSRASSGRFLEPMPAAAEPALAAARRPPGDGVRRWAMMGGAQGYWQVIPGETGPELRAVEDGTKADISHLRLVHASLALSSDARVVAQLNRGRLALAWVDRARPRLDRWPDPFALALDAQEIRLLAVAVDYGDEVVCVLSTDRATYRVDVAPRAQPVVTPIFDAPTRYATILAGHMNTVDSGGRARGWDVNQDRYGIAEVSSLDGARSGGRTVYALAGRDEDGRPIVAENGSTGSLVVRPGTAADEVVVVRPLSGTRAPTEILVSTDGHIERVAADGGS